jgi:transposase-like protein
MASTTDTTTTTIIKSDRIGRSQYRPQYKAEVLAAYRESGMSGHAFAEQCGIKYSTFASWVTKANKSTGQGAIRSSGSPFVLAEFESPGALASRSPLEIKLPGGAIATATSCDQIQLLAELLKALA